MFDKLKKIWTYAKAIWRGEDVRLFCPDWKYGQVIQVEKSYFEAEKQEAEVIRMLLMSIDEMIPRPYIDTSIVYIQKTNDNRLGFYRYSIVRCPINTKMKFIPKIPQNAIWNNMENRFSYA